MNKTIPQTFKAVFILCIMVVFSSAGFANKPAHGVDHDYQNAKMKITLRLPDDWQEKVKIEESDNQVTFKYINPGGEPVFLLAINRITETQWMEIKDQLSNAKLLSHKNGMIIYVERTDKSKIKGANNKEFAAIISKIDEVVQSYKDVQ